VALFGTDRRILALAMARMADGVGNSFLIIVLPLYIASGIVEGRTFGLTESMIIGIVLSLVGFVSSFSQPFTGRVSDRTGRRKPYILFGLGGLTAANLLYLFAGSYLSLIAVRALQGSRSRSSSRRPSRWSTSSPARGRAAATWASTTPFG
jgi:MFS family permease